MNATAAAKIGAAAGRTLRQQQQAAVHWLDLRGAGLSMLERLCLEECLLHHDDRHWIIAGTHEPRPHKYLRHPASSAAAAAASANSNHHHNASIVMGLSGKPPKLLNLDRVRQDSIMTIKRFSGGGTVILDYNSIWISIIGRQQQQQEQQGDGPAPLFAGLTELYPRPIMEWTANTLYTPLFQRLDDRNQRASRNDDGHQQQQQHHRRSTRPTLILDTRSCGAVDHTGRTVSVVPKEAIISAPLDPIIMEPPPPLSSSTFRLHQNDYVLGDRKIGGSAQAIVKNGWIHHTSFLWDYHPDNMTYLQLPDKRPDYRGSRDHTDFLRRIKDQYPYLHQRDFIECLKEVVLDTFAEVATPTTRTALETFQQVGGMNEFFTKKSRTKVLESL
jgi:lipoate-protein ligase A